MISKLGIVLERTDNIFESEGVLNPAVMQTGNEVHMLYRAFRKGNHSSLGYCRLEGPTTVMERFDHPVFQPERAEEARGVEDGRLTMIDGLYYLTYTAYDGYNAMGAVATTTDLVNFSRLGVVTPGITYKEYFHAVSGNQNLSDKYLAQYYFLLRHGVLGQQPEHLIWDKNLVLFPEKINGQFVMFHRLLPGIQVVRFNAFADLTREFWLEYLKNLDQYIVMDPVFNYETSHIGSGCPPVKTAQGWLMIYHAVEVTTHSNVYHASAALLDPDDPQRVIARLRTPLISPGEMWEEHGYVNNVCFPTGTALFGDDLYIYYGAADSCVAAAKVSLTALVEELLKNNRWNYEK